MASGRPGRSGEDDGSLRSGSRQYTESTNVEFRDVAFKVVQGDKKGHKKTKNKTK